MPTDAALNQFLDFLRFGSISTDSKYKEQVLACADWLENKLTAIGLEAAQHETPGHPIIVARGPRKKGRPTVLIYGHYDVQPVDPLDLWHRPPFNPGIENGIVTARGASDNKGQIFAHILGIEQRAEGKGRPAGESHPAHRGRGGNRQPESRAVPRRASRRAGLRCRRHFRFVDGRAGTSHVHLRPARPRRDRSHRDRSRPRSAFGHLRRRGGKSRRPCWRG